MFLKRFSFMIFQFIVEIRVFVQISSLLNHFLFCGPFDYFQFRFRGTMSLKCFKLRPFMNLHPPFYVRKYIRDQIQILPTESFLFYRHSFSNLYVFCLPNLVQFFNPPLTKIIVCVCFQIVIWWLKWWIGCFYMDKCDQIVNWVHWINYEAITE